MRYEERAEQFVRRRGGRPSRFTPSPSPPYPQNKMAGLENSSAPLKPVKRVQFGILSPEEIVSGDTPSSLAL